MKSKTVADRISQAIIGGTLGVLFAVITFVLGAVLITVTGMPMLVSTLVLSALKVAGAAGIFLAVLGAL